MSRSLASYIIIFVIIYGQETFVSCGVSDTDIYWRDYNGTIPMDAIPTGHGTYIGQGIFYIHGVLGMIPGTLYPETKSVVSEAPAGKIVFNNNIKILCSTQPNYLQWIQVNTQQLNSDFLEKCVVGGFEAGGALYIGKIFHEEEWKIGKVFPQNHTYSGLRSWWNQGNGYFVHDFQILMKRDRKYYAQDEEFVEKEKNYIFK